MSTDEFTVGARVLLRRRHMAVRTAWTGLC